MVMKQVRFFLILLLGVVTGACEKQILPEEEYGSSAKGNLRVNIFQLDQIPFETTLRAANAPHCSRLNFAVYDMQGTRIKQVNQQEGDNDFGTAAFLLPAGQYQFVALAHSSNGNPTMTDPQKIQFTNAKGYTDTFLYYTTLTVGEEQQTLSLSLHRIVSLCRIVINDAIPEGITRLSFYYTGGSGHFNAITGQGVTNSKQEATYEVVAGQQQTQYDLYTFLHSTEGTLHVKMTAYDAGDNVQLEHEFDIPMAVNKISWLQGAFFAGFTASATQSVTTTVTIDGTWDGEDFFTF